jgi:cation:H+ antiporter
MTITYLLFFVGLYALVKGADLLVDGASSVAKKLGVSTLVIGLTIVAFGTSTPELIVNILASINGNTDLAIGNILGSSIANIWLILGISAVIYPLAVKRGTVWKEIPFSFLAVIVLAFLASDAFIDGEAISALTRIDGLILISFFAIFIYYIFGISHEETEGNTSDEVKTYSLVRSSLMIIGGIAGLVIGGKWIIDGAIALATSFGVSEAFIGLTIIAIGTSLPELATSAVAAYKKNVDIAVGNIVGSNIFNIFWVLGVSAIIRPLPFSQTLMSDVFVVTVATFLLFAFLFVGKRHTLERWQGIWFILLYIGYIAYLVANA